jgi:O-antigen/teichoic acid export membrane protein
MATGLREREVSPEAGVGTGASVAANIARNFASLLVGRFGSQLIGFLTNAYLARRVAPAGFGAIGLAQAAMTYLTIFSDSGLSTIAVREGAQHPGKVQTLIASVSALRLLLALGCMLAGLLVAGYLPYSEASRQILRVFAISLPVQAIAVDWVFRALQKMHYIAIVQIASSALTLALTLCLVKNPAHVLRVPWIGVVAGAGAVALSLWLLHQVGYHLRFRFGFGAFRRHLAQSIPLCASSLAITLYIQVNYLILGKVHSEAVVGLYSAAARLTVVLSTVHWLYYAAMAPALMALYQVSRPKAAALLGQSVRVTAIFGFGMLAIGLPASRLLVRLVFGPAFTDATPVFGVMLASAAVVAVSHNWGQLAVAAHREQLVLKSTLLGGLMNLVVCAVLIRPLGAVGAATGNLLAEIAVALALFLPWPAEFRGRALRPALGPAAACAIALLVSRAAALWELAWGAGLSAAAYLVGLSLFGSITKNDLQAARSALASLVARPDEGVPRV